MRKVEEQLSWLLRMNQIDLATLTSDPERTQEVIKGLLLGQVKTFSVLAEETRQSELIKNQQEVINQLTEQIRGSQETISTLNEALSSLEDPVDSFYRDLVLSMAAVIARLYHKDKENCVADVLSGLYRGVQHAVDLFMLEEDDPLMAWFSMAKSSGFFRPMVEDEIDDDDEETPEEDDG